MVNFFTGLKEDFIFKYIIRPDFLRHSIRVMPLDLFEQEEQIQRVKLERILKLASNAYLLNKREVPVIDFSNTAKNDTSYQVRIGSFKNIFGYETGRTIQMDIPFNIWFRHSRMFFKYVEKTIGIEILKHVKDWEVFVLLHELAHHIQYSTGQLDARIYSDIVIYQGIRYKLSAYNASFFGHLKQPWEIDANIKAFEMYMRLKERNLVIGL